MQPYMPAVGANRQIALISIRRRPDVAPEQPYRAVEDTWKVPKPLSRSRPGYAQP
jgi:hypothetical protein